MATQCEKIIRHPTDYETITAMEAMNEYGIMRLASRIADINRNTSYCVGSEMVAGVNRCGEKTHYARYFFAKGEA